mmetsp:Transcript_39677/g.64364  ORF Transcript_39677/g.64364 Transcript_39677/m.64364 type:complete len:426 (+) Transcript_39677:98-1375(+)|eukprot:CAMPEP_0184671894 /NCGR_PEP_ID=MMETSP0308-20130426/85775_1 /TAXON_ID=38269 /ORGANISM="Gloeochaete witrockiana, Strain SAG 46.84" /LENGTH=425 /DNA_ID=CAMNT_0027119115 /DNA_START=139 /DNA_END=1416 /DNA_ORIENTATION=+
MSRGSTRILLSLLLCLALGNIVAAVDLSPTLNVTDLIEQKQNLKAKVDEYEKKLIDLAGQVTTANAKIQDYDRIVKEKDASIEVLNTAKKTNEDLKNTAETHLRETTSRAENLQREKQEFELQVQKLSATNRELEEKLQILQETLRKAEEYINDPSVAGAFLTQLSKAVKVMPSLGMNGTIDFVSGTALDAFAATKSSLHNKLSGFPTVARHASILSEIMAYIIFAVPILGCCSCIFSGRIRVNVHHLLTFGHVFFMGFSITLFVLAIGMPKEGPKDPLVRISHDRGIYVTIAISYFGLLVLQLYAVFHSCIQPLPGTKVDTNALATLMSTIITGGHYFSQVWFWAMKDREAKLRSAWWYLAYGLVFALLGVLSFRRLSWQQQNELRRMLFEAPAAVVVNPVEERRQTVSEIEEAAADKEDGKGA